MEQPRIVVSVLWQELLDAHQPRIVGGGGSCYLSLDGGVVVRGDLLDPAEVDAQVAARRLLPIPEKTMARCFQQRRAFAESLCDPDLRWEVQQALASDHPFAAFDRALDEVPIEAERWREEERLADLDVLDRWLARAGVTADPPASMTRTIIEFPRND